MKYTSNGLLKQIRQELNVSQRGLATLLDVSQSTINKWENRRAIPVQNALALMKLLDGKYRLEDFYDPTYQTDVK